MEDDHTGMVTTTFMYTMRERMLMDKIEKLPYEQWYDLRLLFTSWRAARGLHIPRELPADEQT